MRMLILCGRRNSKNTIDKLRTLQLKTTGNKCVILQIKIRICQPNSSKLPDFQIHN